MTNTLFPLSPGVDVPTIYCYFPISRISPLDMKGFLLSDLSERPITHVPYLRFHLHNMSESKCAIHNLSASP